MQAKEINMKLANKSIVVGIPSSIISNSELHKNHVKCKRQKLKEESDIGVDDTDSQHTPED